MTNEAEVKEVDFKRCPFCGEVLDFKKDVAELGKDNPIKLPWQQLPTNSLQNHIFKCYACGATYEVTPVIVGYEARKEGIKHLDWGRESA